MKRQLGAKRERLTRAAFLYLEPKDDDKDFAQCSDCKMFLAEHGLCSLHGNGVKIKPTMSCGLFVPGGPAKESELEHVTKAVTPQESGLVDRQVRCENCISFSDGDCRLYGKLNEDSLNWNLDVKVKPQGCCNAQRGK